MQTAQKLFDQVVTHLYTQGGRSMAEGGIVCAYRGLGGRQCAVGHLLTDAEARAVGEGNNVWGIELPPRLAPFLELLAFLQDAHDSTGGDGVEERLRRVATAFALTYREDQYPPAPAEWR